MSLTQPHLKMSKSAPNPASRILLTDSEDVIMKKIRGAVTDSEGGVSYDPVARPGVSNLLDLLSYFDAAGRSAEELGVVHAGMQLGQFKKLVGETLATGLDGVKGRFERLMKDGDLEGVAERGGRAAMLNAEKTMVTVRKQLSLENPAV